MATGSDVFRRAQHFSAQDTTHHVAAGNSHTPVTFSLHETYPTCPTSIAPLFLRFYTLLLRKFGRGHAEALPQVVRHANILCLVAEVVHFAPAENRPAPHARNLVIVGLDAHDARVETVLLGIDTLVGHERDGLG